jgi:Flp pilus assembly protein TadG
MSGRTFEGANCLRDESGAVAVIFALGLVAIMGVIGAAVDYNRLTQLQTKMQQAVDEAALAAVAGYSGGDVGPEQRRIALRTVEAAMGVSRATVDVRAGPNGQLCVHADVRTKLLLMANQGQKLVGARSCVANNSTYEIALALDNTGSMAESASGQSKLQALQAAATALVQAINSNPKSPAAAVSVVPFASAVNVGSSYQGSGAVWLDRFGQSSIHWQNYVRPAGASWTPASRFDLSCPIWRRTTPARPTAGPPTRSRRPRNIRRRRTAASISPSTPTSPIPAASARPATPGRRPTPPIRCRTAAARRSSASTRASPSPAS